MLGIDRVVVREIRLPLREPFQISSGTVDERRICLVELEQDGVTGWAECIAFGSPNYSPETIDTAWYAIREWVAPRVVGRPIEGPALVHALLEENFRGHEMAKATIEMGCWSLTAELRGESLATLLGGVRDRIDTGVSLGIQPTPDALAERALEAYEDGYQKVKVKIMPGSDIEFATAVREALGPEAQIMVDANSAYTLEDAEHLARLDDLELMMIEQPLGHTDLVRHAQLQEQLRTPICMDESIVSRESAEDMIALGSGRIVNIKPGRVGGFTSSIAIHDLCEANDIPVWAGGMLESGIGRAHNVALASLSNFRLPGDLSPSERYWAQDIVTPEWTMEEDGTMRVPLEEPGLGVRIDVDRIDDLTVRKEEITPG